MIYVEHHDGPEQTDVGRIDWLPGWYGPCRTEAQAIAAAEEHALAMGEATREQLESEQRPDQRVEVAWQVSHGRRPDGWWFAAEVPGRPQEEHGPYSSQAAMLAAKVARIKQLEAPLTERLAVAGKRCTCGRQAIVVYLGSVFGSTGYCGIPDGGEDTGPCPFCGGARHREPYGRCPAYRLRLDQP